jgi:hypothetical protein
MLVISLFHEVTPYPNFHIVKVGVTRFSLDAGRGQKALPWAED